jgi:catechol 2,3-dioxygenase-like lactoylglutathione lyase family enzyme
LTLVSRSNPMQIRHVIIKVDEQDKALSFYTSIVGFVKRLDLPLVAFYG